MSVIVLIIKITVLFVLNRTIWHYYFYNVKIKIIKDKNERYYRYEPFYRNYFIYFDNSVSYNDLVYFLRDFFRDKNENDGDDDTFWFFHI